MVLILRAENLFARLQYIAAFIFKEIFKIPYSITEHQQGFKESESIKINYSDEKIADNELLIPNYGLLHQTGIKAQPINIFEINEFEVFFKSPSTENDGFPFDIFSSTFYLISRYEEYLPHKKDKYGRYFIWKLPGFSAKLFASSAGEYLAKLFCRLFKSCIPNI